MKPSSLLFFIMIMACADASNLKPITFKSDIYKFNSEIEYYLNATKDGGAWAIKYNLVNEHEKALKAIDIDREAVPSIGQDSMDDFLQRYTAIDARPYILEKAKAHEVILFNEAHYFPFHFHFFKTFLEDLSKLDYKYLALEGLGKRRSASIKSIDDLNEKYLTVDPTYAEMIRLALSHGYEIFSYDEDSGGERELKGAQNIASFLKGKQGKALVLCGYDHIKETDTKTYWEYALAGRIKEVMKIDPLTVNQTFFMGRSERKFEDALYQNIVPEVSQVYIDAERQSFKDPDEPSWYDIIIVHPRTTFENGKADWFTNGKTKLKLDISSLDITYPVKILAYDIAQDHEQSTPYDVCEIGNADEQVILYLPSGDYYIIYIGANKSFQQSLSVD